MVKNLPVVLKTHVQFLGWEGPLEKGMQPTAVFQPGEFHGQRNLAGYSPWGHKGSDTTERLTHNYISVNPKISIYPSLGLTLGNHKFVFYICESISVL